MTSTHLSRGGSRGDGGGFGRSGGPQSLIAATGSVTGLSEADVMTALRAARR